MKTNTVLKSLLMASLAVVSACGGDDEGPRTCQGANCGGNVVVAPTPAPPSTNHDYILQNIIPMLQQQYGSIIVIHPITIMSGRVLAAGTYTWAAMYQTYILASISGAGCGIQNANNNNIMSPWGTLNYGCLQNKFSNYVHGMTNGYVLFAKTGYAYYSFFEIFNWFLGTGSSYYQNYYYPVYGGGTNYYSPGYANYQQIYCYDPYWGYGQNWGAVYGYGYGYGQYRPPYYSNGGRFYLNIGFSGQF
jgi:hypothetical protein